MSETFIKTLGYKLNLKIEEKDLFPEKKLSGLYPFIVVLEDKDLVLYSCEGVKGEDIIEKFKLKEPRIVGEGFICNSQKANENKDFLVFINNSSKYFSLPLDIAKNFATLLKERFKRSKPNLEILITPVTEGYSLPLNDYWKESFE